MQFVLDEEASVALLKEVLDIYQATIEAKGLKKDLIADGLEQLPTDVRRLIKECVLRAIRDGLSNVIEQNVTVTDLEPFLDAVASRIVGSVDVVVECVLKVGDAKLLKQLEYIENNGYSHLYPQIYSTLKEGEDCACLMEFIPGLTLHSMIFSPEPNDETKLETDTVSVLNLLTSIYNDKQYKYTQPNLEAIYIRDRFKEKYSKGLERLKKVVRFPQEYEHLRERLNRLSSFPIKVNGQECLSYDDCLKELRFLLPKINCPCSTLVHGDPHPGNIIFSSASEGERIRFLDPNGYIDQGDYLYDFGKMVHWVELMGFIIVERTLGSRLFDFSLKLEQSKLMIDYELSAPFDFPHRLEIVKEVTFRAMKEMATRFEDGFFMDRFPVSLAAAYIGGFSYFEEFHQAMISFCQSLLYLNRAIPSALQAQVD